ncbi:MarR family winged helix-turn-helix transcriptional regulator [Halalkalibacter krulwichiae]|uniref:Transcriptional regulator HosA n=1 Tax=Halalkalibacter krulwichiae TaxID=199441 RepID=A0A1X9MLH6_9BACI|nr:MarR family transcriptional regulator [Halalkalibacter krulwichiae]ARK32721.1 Transcriptional regulator HosA [Halalkalibacter krulwichiae]
MKFTFQDYISIKLHRTDLYLTSLIKAKLEPFNLAPEQNLIMMLLWEKDGLTQNYLVEKLDKDKTNIARMASSLEKKGFVKRIHCPNDRRSIRLYLTPCGEKLGEQVLPITEQFNETVCKGFSREELLQLERLLEKMNDNVRTCL